MASGLAEVLRYERLRKGLNQEDLARLSGVSRTTIHHLERGIGQKPQGATLSRLGKALELDLHVLVSGWESDLTTPPAMAETAFPTSTEVLRQQSEFDWSTNPQVAAMREECPAAFAGFSQENWDELISQMGVGGALTSQGVLVAAARIQSDNETLQKLKLILQTHLRDSARQLIDALYQSILATSNAFNNPTTPSSIGLGSGTEDFLPAEETGKDGL